MCVSLALQLLLCPQWGTPFLWVCAWFSPLPPLSLFKYHFLCLAFCIAFNSAYSLLFCLLSVYLFSLEYKLHMDRYLSVYIHNPQCVVQFLTDSYAQ